MLIQILTIKKIDVETIKRFSTIAREKQFVFPQKLLENVSLWVWLLTQKTAFCLAG